MTGFDDFDDPAQSGADGDGLVADEELLAQLRALCQRHDPVPIAADGFARRCRELASIDAEYVALLQSNAPAEGVRSTATRELSFQFDTGSIDLELAGDFALGTVYSDSLPADVSVVQVGESTECSTDEFGRFSIDLRVPGPLRLLFDLASGRRYATEWLSR